MSQRPQWEIDAIDAMEDAREQRFRLARQWAMTLLRALPEWPGLKVKKGRGQRRNRRNRR